MLIYVDILDIFGYIIMDKYINIAVCRCKSCSTISSCSNNNCLYLTGGRDTNKQHACSYVYGFPSCEITTAKYTVTNQCANLGCQYCCWKADNLFTLRCVDTQYKDMCEFSESSNNENNGLSGGAIAGIVIGSVGIVVIGFLFILKFVVLKNTKSNQQEGKYLDKQKQKQKQDNKGQPNSAINIISS